MSVPTKGARTQRENPHVPAVRLAFVRRENYAWVKRESLHTQGVGETYVNLRSFQWEAGDANQPMVGKLSELSIDSPD